MKDPMDKLAESIKRVAVLIKALEDERDFLKLENASLWAQVHTYQDRDADQKRTG